MSVENFEGYTLRYVKDTNNSGKVKVYVEEKPSFPWWRSKSSHIIHLWPAKDGRPPYICFKSGMEPASFSEAKRLARDWCRRQNYYIKRGISISKQIERGINP